jgi:peptidoglycan hydrolase-like protein with peptidoglycan-binding domain
MFSDQIAHALIAAAKSAGIEPACLCALVEVETAGKAFEQDGRTPALLYERHVAFREAPAGRVRAAFIAAGLAIPKWDKATQYRDERTSAQRLALIGRAKAVDEEIALRSASWGLGQTMGFLAPALGFASAKAMVAHQAGSISGQIDCMVREIKRTHLVDPLNSHDWPHVARIYNGAGYKANQYDTKLADAHKRWERRLATIAPGGAPREVPPEQSLSHDDVREIQQRLRDLGYPEVGGIDGDWGTKTAGALAAFQAHEGLPVTSHYDAATKAALDAAEPRPVSGERAGATASDLAAAGSDTISHAQSAGTIGKVIATAGALGGVSDTSGVLDKVKGVTDQVSTLREVSGTVSDLAGWAVNHWYIFAVVAGYFVARSAGKIIAARVADHRSGVHAGP